MSHEPIRIIAMGGTIDKVYDPEAALLKVGSPAAYPILERVTLAWDVRVTSLIQKDSLDLTAEDRQLLCSRVEDCIEKRIIITHGTDTMIETAHALQDATIGNKTVVITGAVVPAIMSHSDADFNLGAAIMAAYCAGAGVFIAMNGRLSIPDRLVKDRASGIFEGGV